MRTLALIPLLSTAVLVSGSTPFRKLPKGASGVRSTHRQLTESLPSSNRRRLQNEDKKEKKGPSKRDCKITEKTNKVSFKCSSDSNNGGNGIKDRIEFSVETKPAVGAQVQVRYDERDESSDSSTGAAYDIVWNNIVEYYKPNKKTSGDDAAYDPSTDTVVQTLDLTNGWTGLSPVNTIGAQSTFNATSGPTTMVFTITTTTPDDNNTRLTANNMKIDVHIHRFPWKRNESYVALIATVNAKSTVTTAQMEPKSLDESPTAASTPTVAPAPTVVPGSKGAPKAPKKAIDVTIDLSTAMAATGVIPFGSFTWETTATAGSPPKDFTPNTGSSASSSTSDNDKGKTPSGNTVTTPTASPSEDVGGGAGSKPTSRRASRYLQDSSAVPSALPSGSPVARLVSPTVAGPTPLQAAPSASPAAAGKATTKSPTAAPVTGKVTTKAPTAAPVAGKVPTKSPTITATGGASPTLAPVSRPSTSTSGSTTATTQDSTTIQVVATTLTQTEKSTAQQIAFSFVGDGAHSDYIYWDPEAGVGYSSSSSGNNGSSGASSFAAIRSFSVVIVGSLVGTVILMMW